MSAPELPWNSFRPLPVRGAEADVQPPPVDDEDGDDETEQLADDVQVPKSLVVSWFPTAMPVGPAIGDPEATTWSAFTSLFRSRREGPKDGTLFCPCRFRLEPDGRHVRRLARNVIARTAVALDCETNKQTGEIPPAVDVVVHRVRAMGWAAVVYTSHSHVPITNVHFRVVLPLEEEIDPELPAPEIVADALGLAAVLDRSKLSAASIFYLPSCADIAQEDQHQTIVCPGTALAAAWVRKTAGTLLAEREAEQDRIAAEAHAAAQRRLESRIAAGFNPDDSLIEKLQGRFDLTQVLLNHGYDRQGTKFRHPNSTSGSFGADIKTYGGIERVYSHNGTDPLHRDNLPDWCGGVTALDVVDVVIILDFAGNRDRALRELAQRFGLTKAEERKAVAKIIFRMMRQQAPQEAIDTAAQAEGLRLGLSPAEVIAVANWCVQNLQGNGATAPEQEDLSDHPEETVAPGDADDGDIPTPEGEHRNPGQGTSQSPAHELPRIKWTNERLSDWADRDIPERLWVVSEWIPRGQCTGLYGVGGVNKTDFLIQLGLAKSKGLPFLGHMLEAGPVYALFLEDSREEVIRRAIRIAKTAWGYDSLDVFQDFHFVSLVGFDEPEFVAFDGTKMEIKQALYLVDQKIMEIGAHLCTLDTLPHFFGGNEIVRREVSRFIRKLDGISIVRQCAFVASAHPSARGRQTGSMESGSTGWEGGFRARLGLHDPGLDGDDEDKQAPRIASDRRVLTRIKSNYAKQGETLDLVIRDGTFFVTAVGPEAANRPPKSGPGRDAACDDKFLELIAAVEGQGSHVNESVHSGRYAPKAFRARQDGKDFSAPEYIRAMERLFAAKRIRVVPFGAPSKAQRKIIDMQAEPEVAPEVAPDPTPEPTPPPPAPPTEAEIGAEIARHIGLDEGKRALQRVITAKRLGDMPLKVFDALVKVALREARPGETIGNGGNQPENGVADE